MSETPAGAATLALAYARYQRSAGGKQGMEMKSLMPA